MPINGKLIATPPARLNSSIVTLSSQSGGGMPVRRFGKSMGENAGRSPPPHRLQKLTRNNHRKTDPARPTEFFN